MPPREGDVKNLLEIPRNEIHSEEGLEIERQREVKLLQERINKGGRPLNVALIGLSGSGKSSFCNSIIAAFSVGDWKKRATTGHYGGHGEQVTHHLLSFPKIEYLDFDALYDYNYPTLIDMNGFEDSCDALAQELLRIVFFGRLPNEERLTDAVKLYNSKGLDGLKEKYSQSNECLKVDRIIFIASAYNFSLPTRLMEAVRNTARKENRVIPIFGVLTHKDKISRDDSDYMRLEQEFIEGLGIPENRFLLSTTYCDAYDKHHGKSRLDQRHSAIDIPILKFMQLVCDPATRVIRDKQTYTGEEPPKELNTNTPKKPSPEPKPQPIPELLDIQRLVRMWVKGAIIAVIFFLFLPLISYEREMQRICARHGTGVSSYCGDQSMVGKMFASFVFAAFLVVLDIAFDRFNQLLF
uniref:Uncharacterized protein n=1 Tax=Magallana gigas TaxID=29159 RepID=A0A8W8HRI0_MAGGI